MRRRRGCGTHEEDDDGGDADGGDEDPLVVVAAALQLPVDGHPLVAAADLLRPSGSNSGEGIVQEEECSTAAANGNCPGLSGSVELETCGAAGAGTEREMGGRVWGACVSAARMGREILIAPVRPRRPRSQPADARSARADNWTFVANERTPGYVAATGGGAPNNGR